MRVVVAALVVLATLVGPVASVGAGTAGSSQGACGRVAPGSIDRYDHVVTIVLENHSFGDIGASPTLRALARACGLATRYQAITHPSLPNYLALTAGDTLGVTSDCTACTVRGPSIFSQVRGSWHSYLEGLPAPGFTGASSGTYAKKHNPAAYFPSLARVFPTRAVPLGSPTSGPLAHDLRTGRLPRYALVVPDLCNDEHDCPTSSGDAWLARWLPAILGSPTYRAGRTAVFVTYDEGTADNHVYTVVAAPSVRPGTTSARPFSHYSLLAAQESMLGLHCLRHACDRGASLRRAFGI